MKPIEFLVWLRDKVKVIRHSKEGNGLDRPSNGELRRWIKNGCLFVNGKIVSTDNEIEFPVESLILFPKSQKSKCTIV